MPYTLFGNWEEPEKEEEVKEPPKKTKRMDLFREYYTSKERAKELTKEINETHCWVTPSKVERQLNKLWEKEDKKQK